MDDTQIALAAMSEEERQKVYAAIGARAAAPEPAPAPSPRPDTSDAATPRSPDAPR